MNIKPLGNRILVRRSTVKSTKGGILLPDTAQEKPKEGEVIAVGPGKMSDRGEVELVYRQDWRSRDLRFLRRNRSKGTRMTTKMLLILGFLGKNSRLVVLATNSLERKMTMAKMIQFNEDALRSLSKGVRTLSQRQSKSRWVLKGAML